MSRRALVLPGAALALALTLVGCTGPTGAPASPSASASDAAPSPSASVVTSPTPDTEADGPLTCDTLIPSDVVESFTKQGWTAKTDAFHIGSTEVPDGLWCVWGDYSVASDHVQIYGFAEIDDATATAGRQELLDSGWKTVDDASGDYLTEDPRTALGVDDEGYGMTYQFGDGWVSVSDTKQGLLLIEHPGD